MDKEYLKIKLEEIFTLTSNKNEKETTHAYALMDDIRLEFKKSFLLKYNFDNLEQIEEKALGFLLAGYMNTLQYIFVTEWYKDKDKRNLEFCFNKMWNLIQNGLMTEND